MADTRHACHRLVSILTSPDFFGEESLTPGTEDTPYPTSRYSVSCETLSTMIILNADDFLELMQNSPDLQKSA